MRTRGDLAARLTGVSSRMLCTNYTVPLLGVGACAVALVLSGIVVAGQEKPTIWTGVFTQAQADHGRRLFDDHCAVCHGTNLNGGDGPSLIGGDFNRGWYSHHLDRLFKKVQTRMPVGDVAAVPDKDKVDIIAYILQRYGFPVGAKELTLDLNVLSAIQIVGPNGPEPPPSGALVEVTGCLTGEGKEWTLTNATEPAVSTMDDPAADAIAAAKRPLGKETVRLLDVFPNSYAAEHQGHKMLAKGLLIRNSTLSLSVMHLGVVGTAC